MNVQPKQCSKCGDWFPATTEHFHRDRQKKDGLRYQCKSCTRKQQRDYREANADKERQYRESNVYRSRDLQRQWRQSNRDRAHGIEHRWRKANPENKRLSAQRRRARKRGAEGSFSAAEAQLQLETQKGCCWWCGKRFGEGDLKPSIDHRIPLAKGGGNGAGNIVWAHLKCNVGKGAKMPWHLAKPRLL